MEPISASRLAERRAGNNVATAAAAASPPLIGRACEAKEAKAVSIRGPELAMQGLSGLERFRNNVRFERFGELQMTTFDDRERSFEKKFALDEELKFKSEQRRNRLLGEWAAGKLGLTGPAVEEYVRALRKADLATKGDEDVFQKVRKDFEEKGVAVPDAELRRAMSDCLSEAVSQIEAARKPG